MKKRWKVIKKSCSCCSFVISRALQSPGVTWSASGTKPNSCNSTWTLKLLVRIIMWHHWTPFTQQFSVNHQFGKSLHAILLSSQVKRKSHLEMAGFSGSNYSTSFAHDCCLSCFYMFAVDNGCRTSSFQTWLAEHLGVMIVPDIKGRWNMALFKFITLLF